MVRVHSRSRSSITLPPPPLIHYVPSKTASKIISNHLTPLWEKRYVIEEMQKVLSLGKPIDAHKQELLRSWPLVANQISVLEKVYNEIHSKSDENRPLSIIAKQLHDLRQKQALISQIEACIYQGEVIYWGKQKVLYSKSEVVQQVNLLDKIFKEICLGQLPLREPKRGAVEYELNPLMSKSRGCAEIISFGLFQTMPVQAEESRLQQIKAVRNLDFCPRMNENETREATNPVESQTLDKQGQRYLCVSNGFEMYCLDLEQSKDQSLTLSITMDVPFLPKIATLKLLEGGVPVASVGLFKWGSDKYMIGGKMLEGLVVNPNYDPLHLAYQGFDPRGYILDKLYKEGSSRDTHHLSLTDDGTLSCSESNTIARLNKPKLWPIVEKIAGQIHVMDSLPPKADFLVPDWTFSHEVLCPDSGSWIEIETSEDMLHIRSQLAVGDRIFAVAPVHHLLESRKEPCYLVFDSKEKKWEPSQRHEDGDSIKEVWDILELGPARCVGRISYGGEPSDLLYVVIALQRDHSHADLIGTDAVAYLVATTGQVVCIQPLPHFFKGPVLPCYMFQGQIIEVDEEGKTMCSIVTATPWDNSSFDFVFINTFTVEELPSSKVGQVWEEGSEAWPVWQEFVCVDIKERYVYQTDAKLEGGIDISEWISVQACFL